MKYRKIISISLTIALIASSMLITNFVSAQDQERVIVVFKNNSASNTNTIKSVGGEMIGSLPSINGLVVNLPSKAAKNSLKNKANILRIDRDIEVSIAKRGGNSSKPTTEPPAQTTEWWITQTGADQAWANSTGDAVKVAVIDTGVDKSHSDLINNIKGGINFVVEKGKINPNNIADANGHGTHVAGIVAASHNNIGVVGVAHNSDIYAVRALNSRGSGYLSDIIKGIEWSINNNMDVINMSLGANVHVQSFEDACNAAYAAGIVIVAAAGNEGTSISYPAAYGSVISVAATDSNNVRPWWSNFGPQAELSAPGVGIFSTYKGNSYKELSGTSMASPNVAGVAALLLNAPINPNYDYDIDGTWDPNEVRQALRDTADDLGSAGFDYYYGYGLVDAEEVINNL